MDQRQAVIAHRNAVDAELPVSVGSALASCSADLHYGARQWNTAVDAVGDATGNAGQTGLLSGQGTRRNAGDNAGDKSDTDDNRSTHATAT